MELFALIPLIVIIVGAFQAVSRAKSRNPSKRQMALFWVILLIFPFVLQGIAAMIFFSNPLEITSFQVNLRDWFRVDLHTEIPARYIRYTQETLCRTVAAIVGLYLAWAACEEVLRRAARQGKPRQTAL